MKRTGLCSEDCDCCPIVSHPNSRMLTKILNELLDKLGNEVYKIVQHNCPNLTACYDCRIDDFSHFEECEIMQLLEQMNNTKMSQANDDEKLGKELKDKIICLSCGWTGSVAELSEHGACPDCGYENGASPFRLLTLGEMLEGNEESGYMNVRLDLFLGTLFRLAGVDTNLQ